VGARSAVTKEFPADFMCVGSPAKPVRKDVTWTNEDLP
jgi:acetyltransferase-like isoleucine patch superfamily enzyme